MATHHARRAQSYHFLAGALHDLFGPKWRDLPCKELPVSYSRVGEAVDTMEALYHGASVRARRELGLKDDPTVLADRDLDADEAALASWIKGISRDPDLRRDSRMMVPLLYDPSRRKMKVWALLGWYVRDIEIDFATPPTIIETYGSPPVGIFQQMKRALTGATPPEVIIELSGTQSRVAVPVTAELYVNSVLDRDAFRALCDKHRTRSAIIEALADP